jgi:hypothetical protein
MGVYCFCSNLLFFSKDQTGITFKKYLRATEKSTGLLDLLIVFPVILINTSVAPAHPIVMPLFFQNHNHEHASNDYAQAQNHPEQSLPVSPSDRWVNWLFRIEAHNHVLNSVKEQIPNRGPPMSDLINVHIDQEICHQCGKWHKMPRDHAPLLQRGK